MADTGDVYDSRSEAFTALINNADIDLDVINRFKKGFSQEGWETGDFLPENWLVKRQAYGSSYMSPTGEILTSTELTVRYMIENEYTMEEIDLFKDKECPKVKPKVKVCQQESSIVKEELKNVD